MKEVFQIILLRIDTYLAQKRNCLTRQLKHVLKYSNLSQSLIKRDFEIGFRHLSAFKKLSMGGEGRELYCSHIQGIFDVVVSLVLLQLMSLSYN